MNQNQQTLTETPCGNSRFRNCSVSVDTHRCVNCNKAFTDGVKEGDVIVGKCEDCEKENIKITVNFVFPNSISGKCDACEVIEKSIGKLYEDFRGEGYGFPEHEDGSISWNEFTDEKFDEDLEAGVEAIANLPKEHLKIFLKRIHGAVER